MKPVQLFVLENCPYCRQAFSWMEELKRENPEYSKVEMTVIDEGKQPDLAGQYDYYYVPTYYVDGVKVHEGAATKEKIKSVFEKALQ
jgi:glutaredoxin